MRATVLTALAAFTWLGTCGCHAPSDQLPVPAGHNGECNPALLDAIHRHDSDRVKALRERGAIAHCPELATVLTLLLKGGADPNGRWHFGCGNAALPLGYQANDTTPLMMAAAAGDAEFVSLLLDAGADVRARDSKGRVARDYARVSSELNQGIIEALLSR